MNPWEKLRPPIPLKEVEEIGFKRASREANKIPYKSKIDTARKRERTRVKVLYETVKRHINRGIKVLDAYFEAHKFYRDLITLYFPDNEIRRIHKRLVRLIDTLDKISDEYIHKINMTDDPEEMSKYRRVAQGKMGTFLKKIDQDFEFIRKLYKYGKNLPSIDPEIPIFLVAGPPNTGKSTLVNLLSTAEVKTAEYPFTTKNIHVGHIIHNYLKAQIIDTPGLLDRRISERNEIELKAIYALKNLDGDIIYLFDVSPDSYYPIENQINIYDEIVDSFPGKTVIPVANKIDIKDPGKLETLSKKFGEGLYTISCKERMGIDRLINKIIKSIEMFYVDRLIK